MRRIEETRFQRSLSGNHFVISSVADLPAESTTLVVSNMKNLKVESSFESKRNVPECLVVSGSTNSNFFTDLTIAEFSELVENLIQRACSDLFVVPKHQEWPPIMRVPSHDLKRCLGDPDMDNRTLWARLEKLGYSRNADFISTEGLVQKVNDYLLDKENLKHIDFKPISEYGKELLQATSNS